jgi:Fur family transcriptional regulator, ferric uptake regulator
MPAKSSSTTPPAPDLAAQLRARGLRVTAQREQVLTAVQQLRHATPEQISEAVPGADLTTVYRTLELLEELGFIRHTHLGHGAPAYRPAEDQHVHVVCHSCGRVSDVDPALVDELAARLESDRGFVVDRAHFTVFGRCADCRTEQNQAPAGLSQHAHDEPHEH